MADEPNGAGGQAPTSSPSQGQAPQVNNSGSPSAASLDQASGGHTAPTLSAEDAARLIADLRKENAGHRTERNRIEAELRKFQDAQLTDQQKRERDFSELQTKALDYEMRLQRLTLENAGYRMAGQLGINDISAALALVQAEHAHEIAYEADGTPKNLTDLLKAVVKDHPILAQSAAASAAQQRQQAAAQAPVANPGRQAGNGGLTLEMIRAMPMRERVARIAEIEAWEKAQRNQQSQSQ